MPRYSLRRLLVVVTVVAVGLAVLRVFWIWPVPPDADTGAGLRARLKTASRVEISYYHRFVGIEDIPISITKPKDVKAIVAKVSETRWWNRLEPGAYSNNRSVHLTFLDASGQELWSCYMLGESIFEFWGSDGNRWGSRFPGGVDFVMSFPEAKSTLAAWKPVREPNETDSEAKQ